LRADEVARGDPDVGEGQLRGVRGAPTHRVQAPADLESGHPPLEDEEGEPAAAPVLLAAGAHRGRDEVRTDARGDVGLGPGDDVLVTLPSRRGPQAAHVGAAVRLGDALGAGRLAGEGGGHPALDLGPVTGGDDVRAGDAGGEERGVDAARGPCLVDGLGDRDRRALTGGATTGRLGEADPDETEVAGGTVQGAGELAVSLPLVLVRQDLTADEL